MKTYEEEIELTQHEQELLDGLSDRHRFVIDEMFLNGFNASAAFRKINNTDNVHNSCVAASSMLKRPDVKIYIRLKQAEYRRNLHIDKQTLMDQLVKMIREYDVILELAAKETLTDSEKRKFARLKSVVNMRDVNKARDMLARMLGAYAPEVIEHTGGVVINYNKPKSDGN